MLDVAEQTDPNNGQTVKHYLVKWRALQYEDSTWELQDDVDPAKIKQFEIFSKLPPKDQWKVILLNIMYIISHMWPNIDILNGELGRYFVINILI